MDIWGVTCPAHQRAIENDYRRHVDDGLGGVMRRALTSWLAERGMSDVEVVVRRDERVGPNLFILWFEPEDGWPAAIEDEINQVAETAHLEWMGAAEPWVTDNERIARVHELTCGASRE